MALHVHFTGLIRNKLYEAADIQFSILDNISSLTVPDKLILQCQGYT